MSVKSQPKTTGQLRALLANCAKEVVDGTMDIHRAAAVHKLAKNITESMYSETKIAIFAHEAEQPVDRFGMMPIGEPDAA